MTRHTRGELFTAEHLEEGEILTDTGHIRRGDFLILSDPDGYRLMENFDARRLSRVHRETLRKTRTRVDLLQKTL